jgi:hypothetical protein
MKKALLNHLFFCKLIKNHLILLYSLGVIYMKDFPFTRRIKIIVYLLFWRDDPLNSVTNFDNTKESLFGFIKKN